MAWKKKKEKKGTVHVKIKSGDMVVLTAGKDYNRYDTNGNRVPHRGKVLAVKPRLGKVKVEGAGIIKKHQKANPQMNIEGGIIEKEAWIDISNVALIDPDSGKPTRVRIEKDADGNKIRVAVKSGKQIPEPVRES